MENNRERLLSLHRDFIGHNPEKENTMENETMIVTLLEHLWQEIDSLNRHSHSITIGELLK